MPDVVVVGGGVVGLSAATYLARAGATVTLCERGELYQGASSKNLGLLSNIDVPAGVSRDLHKRGRELFLQIPEETGHDIGLQYKGSVTYGRACDGDGVLFESVYRSNSAEVDLELLDRRQLRELVPALNEDYDTGLFSRDEAKFENSLVCQALAKDAQRHGARLIRGTEIAAIDTVKGVVRGVRTRGGQTISADAVILAAGVGTEYLARSLGVHVPMIVIRGQAAITAPVAPVLDTVIYSKEHIEHNGSLMDAFVAAQTADSRIMFGGPVEAAAEHEVPTVNGVAIMADNLRTALPVTAEAPVDRIWAGMAVFAADGLPIAGRVPQCEGLLLAVGALNTAGPAVGEMVAALAEGKHPRFESDLSPARCTSVDESHTVWARSGDAAPLAKEPTGV